MSYELFMKSATLNTNKADVFKNKNADYIATYDGLKNVAVALESVSNGDVIGSSTKWCRKYDNYSAHYSILPVVAFNKVNDAIQFIELLRVEHPLLEIVGYTDLKYAKLALNDIPTNVNNTNKWNGAFNADTMINISIGKGFKFSIHCPHQAQLQAHINNYSHVPEVQRIEMFIDYCRRTAPKR